MAEFRGHKVHIRIDVMKEGFVAGAEIVEALFTIGCLDKTMFRAFAMTCKPYVTFTAVPGQRVSLI